MLLQGLVLSGQVLESTFYDQVTGQPKPGYSVKLTVLDAETDEKYECQLSDGLPSLTVTCPLTGPFASEMASPEGVENRISTERPFRIAWAWAVPAPETVAVNVT